MSFTSSRGKHYGTLSATPAPNILKLKLPTQNGHSACAFGTTARVFRLKSWKKGGPVTIACGECMSVPGKQAASWISGAELGLVHKVNSASQVRLPIARRQ